MNKKPLIKKGYSFEKIGKDNYLVIPLRTKKTVKELGRDFRIALKMRNHFLKESIERGKALSIIIPLIGDQDVTELLSELYDLRSKLIVRKNER